MYTVLYCKAQYLMVVRGAVGQPGPLVVPVTQERLLAPGAGEVLHMPVFPQRGDNSPLYRPPARPAHRNVHLIMAAETVELPKLVGSKAGPGVISLLILVHCK